VQTVVVTLSTSLLADAVLEDSLAPDSQRDNGAADGDSWGLPEISGRGIIPMASEEELEELQDMVDELLNSDSNEGQAGQGIISKQLRKALFEQG